AASHEPGRVRKLLDGTSAEQIACLEREVLTMVSSVLHANAQDVDRRTALTDLGIDSLMAVELKNRIRHDVGVDLPLVKLLEGPSAAELSRLLLAHIKLTGLDALAVGDAKEIEI